MGFEKFKHLDGSIRAKITLRENGQIGFSKGAVNRFKLYKFDYCELYYDRDSERIGIRFTGEKENGATAKINKRPFNNYISARPFLDHYGISYIKARSFIAQEDEESELIVLDLKNPLPSRRKSRKEKQNMDEK